MMQTLVTYGKRLVTSRGGSQVVRGLLSTFFGGRH
jgi:hypothetical protein